MVLDCHTADNNACNPWITALHLAFSCDISRPNYLSTLRLQKLCHRQDRMEFCPLVDQQPPSANQPERVVRLGALLWTVSQIFGLTSLIPITIWYHLPISLSDDTFLRYGLRAKLLQILGGRSKIVCIKTTLNIIREASNILLHIPSSDGFRSMKVLDRSKFQASLAAQITSIFSTVRKSSFPGP